MEASIAIRSAVAAPDLAELVTADGPFATVYLSTDPAVENAAQRAERAWKGVRRELEGAGVPSGALEQIGDLVADAHLWGRAMGAVATDDGLAHVEIGQQAPSRDLGRWEPLPSLVPMLEWRQATPPHVAVLVDRTGADLFAFRPDAPNVHREVQADDDPHIRKVKPGGWSQRRFQQSAENLWEENAEEVAHEVARLVEEVDARLVVAAGDVRAMGFLREHLPQKVADLVTTTDGARQPDGSDDQMVEEVERILAVAVAQDSTSLLETFHQEFGQGDRAVAGTVDVLGALFRSQVEVLLVYDHLDDDRRAWFGPDPSHAASTEQTLRELGVEPRVGRLVDVAVRAALGTGARIRVVPAESGIADGVGAVLRWS